MAPIKAIELALSESLRDSSGLSLTVLRKPGLSDDEIAAFEAQLPGPLPQPIRELLSFCAGFGFPPVGFVDLRGEETSGLEEILPRGRVLLGDGFGNQWVIDVDTGSGVWGPVFFVCHDPPVLVLQSVDLAEFLDQVFDLGRPPKRSAIHHVRTEVVRQVWTADPFLNPVEGFRQVADETLATFARQLPDGWMVADLRSLQPAQGFAWGRFGPNTCLRRSESDLIFAAGPPQRRGLLQRLFHRERKS